MGEETSARSPRKTSLGHLRAVKQLIYSSLRPEEAGVDPEAFHSIQLDISRIFLCKQANESELLNCKTIGTFGQMAIAYLNNSYTHKVKKT